MPRNLPYVVVDFETTGVSPRREEVVETGAVQVDGGRPGAAYDRLARPSVPIRASAERIHGISVAMLENESTFDDQVPDLLDFIGDRIFVAHHARFDWAFFEAALRRRGLPLPAVDRLDTLRLSRRLFPEFPRHDLRSLTRTHGIRLESAHRALPDALATAELLGVLIERAEELGLPIAEWLALGRPPAWGGAARYARVLLSESEQYRLEEAQCAGDLVALTFLTRQGNRRTRDIVPYAVDRKRDVPRLVAYDIEARQTRIWSLFEVLAVGEPGGET